MIDTSGSDNMNTMTLSYVFGDDWTTVPIKPIPNELEFGTYATLGEWQFDENNGVSEDTEYMDDRFEKVMQSLKEHDYEIDYRFLSKKHRKALLEYKENIQSENNQE